jgi:hypothetical protein
VPHVSGCLSQITKLVKATRHLKETKGLEDASTNKERALKFMMTLQDFERSGLQSHVTRRKIKSFVSRHAARESSQWAVSDQDSLERQACLAK